MLHNRRFALDVRHGKTSVRSVEYRFREMFKCWFGEYGTEALCCWRDQIVLVPAYRHTIWKILVVKKGVWWVHIFWKGNGFYIRLLFEATALPEVAWGLLVEMKLVGVYQVALLRISTFRSTLHYHCFCCLVSISHLRCCIFHFLLVYCLVHFSAVLHSSTVEILIIPVWNGGRYFCVQGLDVFSCLFTFGNVACWERNLINWSYYYGVDPL